MSERNRSSETGAHERPAVSLDDIGSLSRQKRRNDRLSLEQAAQQAGVSAATLWRLERRTSAAAGKDLPMPDVRTLGAITDWLGVSLAGAGFAPVAATESPLGSDKTSTPDTVEAHLRADPKLDSATAALLARMFRAAYSEFTQSSPGDPANADDAGQSGKEAEG